MKTHVVRLVDESGAHDLPAHVWMIRRFLDLEHRFSAFEGLPISKERRYFIRDGAVLCHHPYWTNDVIAKWYVAVGDQEKELREICGDEGTPAFVKTRLPHDWEKILATLNEESDAEVEYLKLQAERIAKEFPGYWSVDFACEAGTGAWFVIDMAPGDESYHVEGCDHGKR